MYTIEDLKGKYMKAGTPEAEVFLDACENLGVMWHEGEFVKEYSPKRDCIGVKIKSGTLCTSNEGDYINNGYTPFTPKPQWSIYTNDKPLCELSDEQAAKLFNAWRGGSDVDVMDDSRIWRSIFESTGWSSDLTYRIKQKSGRELFVEKCVELTSDHDNESSHYKHWFETIFDAGARFKDGE